MVVQRTWKLQSDAPTTSAASAAVNKSLSVGGSSSSEDSNGSNQTTHSIATSLTSSSYKTQESVATVPSNSESFKFVTTPQMAENMLLRLRQRLCPPVATPESVMNSLDLLRSHLQSLFDKEIEPIIKNFMDTYFKPAVKNIKENMGENSITDAMLKTIVCSLLEESKKKYLGLPVKPNFSHNTVNGTETQMSSRLCTKRPASKSVLTNEPVRKIVSSSIQPTASVKTNTESTDPLARKLTVAQPRRQIFWNTADLSTNTNFVLDVQANQAYGFGTDGKERLASKHPELIRYLPDGQDRDWLVSQNIISQQNRNSRFLFLIHDEVLKLYHNNDLYKNKPNISLSIMHTFKVPEFMIEKMKVFFVDLNIKSRGLITNSFCAAPTQNSGSHLRNALLQGAQTTPSTTTIVESGACNAGVSSASVSANNVSTTTEVVVVAVNSNQSKSKPSTLSSSHATLTALLNNPNSSSVGGNMIKTNSINSGRNGHSTDAAGKMQLVGSSS